MQGKQQQLEVSIDILGKEIDDEHFMWRKNCFDT